MDATDEQRRDIVLRAVLRLACAAVAASVLMPWATLDPAVGSTTRIRAGTVGLVLAALATGVVALSWSSTKRGATLPGRISVALGGSAAVVSIVLALRAMSTANGLATAGPSATSYAIGSGLAVVASLTVVAVTVARSTH